MKYPAGEYFTTIPFIFTLHINQFPPGWFPRSLASLCPRLSFISSRLLSSPQMAAPPPPPRPPRKEKKNRSSTLCCVQGRRDQPRQLFEMSACVLQPWKCKCVHWARDSLSHGCCAAVQRRSLLKMSVQISELTCGFFMGVEPFVSDVLQRLELICDFVIPTLKNEFTHSQVFALKSARSLLKSHMVLVNNWYRLRKKN